MSLSCHYCNRKYKLKENFDKHFITCEYLHKMKMKSHDDIVESMEIIPNQREMFQLIKSVMLKNSLLENEIKQLKNTVNIRYKKEVLDWLNLFNNDNRKTFMESYKSIELLDEDLKTALDNDLTKATEHIMKRILEKSSPPVSRFKEKPNQLFIYDFEKIGEPTIKWKLASHTDIEKMVLFLSHALLKKFVNWQNENRSFFMENDKNKDLEILYMSRIAGIKNPVERRTADIKKWLYGLSSILMNHGE